MHVLKPAEAPAWRSLWRRVGRARESELFGPRGRLPRRGEPDLRRRSAVAVVAGLTLGGLVLRLVITRGIWLDEAISIHEAHLTFREMMESLQISDRHPPLHYAVLWVVVRTLGDGELAVRLPSLVAGTLVIPALYLLGRELYDRRTGAIAAALGAASPLLVWYAQEARMYAFVTLFGLLALWTQLRAIRNGSTASWAAYILATAALLWSHYFGLLLIVVQQLIFIGVIVHRRRTGEPVAGLAIGFAYSAAILALQLVPLGVFAVHQFHSTGAGEALGAQPNGRYDSLSFYAAIANMAWALWGYHPDGTTELLGATWPLLLLFSLLLLGRGGSRQTVILAAAAISPLLLLLGAAELDPQLFEVRYFLVVLPLLLVLIARLVTGWIRRPRAMYLVTAGIVATMLLGLADQQTNPGNPRLYDFRGAIEEIRAEAGPRSLVLFEPPDMRYVMEYYAPGLQARPLRDGPPPRRAGSPLFVLASFQDDPVFFNRTNKVVGQIDFSRRLVRRFKKPQTLVWEFR
jgi:dolichyl-phosphate-mannose-protein mannosyltransferase